MIEPVYCYFDYCVLVVTVSTRGMAMSDSERVTVRNSSMPEDRLTRSIVVQIRSLNDLSRIPHPRLMPSNTVVELLLSGLEPDERTAFEQKLSTQLRACGCNEGSIAVSLVILATICAGVFGVFRPFVLTDWIAVLAIVLLGSLVGKVTGLTLAHWRARRIAQEIRSTVLARGGQWPTSSAAF